MKRAIGISIMVVAGILATGLANDAAWAGLVTADPSLPPTDGEYRSPSDYGPEFVGTDIQIAFRDIVYQALATPPPTRTPIGPDELEDFESTLTAIADVTYLGSPLGSVPFTLSGPSTWLASNKAGNTTGTFQVEIVSLSLSGNVNVPGLGLVPILLRESPTTASLGQTDITDIGGGLCTL